MRWFLLFLLLFITPLRAADVDLEWDYAPEPILGFTLYIGNERGVYSRPYDLGWTHHTIVTGVVPGKPYYFAVQAYRDDCWHSDFGYFGCARFESALSDELRYQAVDVDPWESLAYYLERNHEMQTPYKPILGLFPKILRRPKMLRAYYRDQSAAEMAAIRKAAKANPKE